MRIHYHDPHHDPYHDPYHKTSTMTRTMTRIMTRTVNSRCSDAARTIAEGVSYDVCCRVGAGSDEDEKRVKEETGATLRCFPLEQPAGPHTCFMTGAAASEVALFAKAY